VEDEPPPPQLRDPQQAQPNSSRKKRLLLFRPASNPQNNNATRMLPLFGSQCFSPFNAELLGAVVLTVTVTGTEVVLDVIVECAGVTVHVGRSFTIPLPTAPTEQVKLTVSVNPLSGIN
jgi:hypothetical protein